MRDNDHCSSEDVSTGFASVVLKGSSTTLSCWVLICREFVSDEFGKVAGVV